MLVRQEEVFMRELRRNGEDGRIMITRVLSGDILKRFMAVVILKLRVIDRCFGKPPRRLITEAIRMEEVNDCEAMNSKREWTYTNLNKVNVA